jgi:ABC-2 type transport system ATP-binding protein
MSAALEATGLSKSYGRHWALRDCSFTLPAGRTAALVGPNGAGKTTLLHLAVGLLQPSRGSIRVLGSPAEDRPELLARVGFVAQDVPLYHDFTAAELLRLGTKLNPRFDNALADDRFAQLGIARDRPVGTLSGGQRAQVALALALAKRPELLLLDEPVASLDPLARREFLQALMAAVADSGATVMLSSHLVGDLERVCDYLLLLSAAHVQVAGDVDGLLAGHKLLVGPYRDPGRIPPGLTVVHASHTDRQTTLLVRTSGPILDPAWTVADLTLEDLVLAYMRQPTAGALPGPQRSPTGTTLGNGPTKQVRA